MKPNWENLFAKIGFEISDSALLREAFTHRSVASEKAGNNERLEFLGDAVLELVATEFLFKKFPKKPEGELTNLRSALVKGDHLAEVARRLEFGELLILSKGEATSGGRQKGYLLANALEAFIGAIYLNKNFEQAQKFISKFILVDLDEILKKNLHIDAKSEFQEKAQSLSPPITPQYQVLADIGKDHDKTFEMGAFVGEKMVGKGRGKSKKEAEIAAAASAIQNEKKWSGGKNLGK